MAIAQIIQMKKPSLTSLANSLKLGPIQVTTGQRSLSRIAILLWGPAGCGKTTWAVTAPGNKLLLSVGDNEHVSVAHRPDVMVADMSGLTWDKLFKDLQSENPFDLDRTLANNKEIDTVILDNLTAVTFMALQKAVAKKLGAGDNFIPSMETPGRTAYGGRNTIVLECLTGLLKVTKKHNVHFVCTAHEADPTTSGNGKNEVMEYIGIQLGGQIVNNTSWRFSEIWYMSQSDTGEKYRRIAIRPTRKRRPMKTRMFTDKGDPEFYIDYDAEQSDTNQITIASMYKNWVDGGGKKLSIPRIKNAARK